MVTYKTFRRKIVMREIEITRILKRNRITEKSFRIKIGIFKRLFKPNLLSDEIGAIIYSSMRQGVELGLTESSIEGQRISLQYSAKTDKQKEYLKKLYALHDEYGMGFRYSHLTGMELFEL